jgi:hypothetical protein
VFNATTKRWVRVRLARPRRASITARSPPRLSPSSRRFSGASTTPRAVFAIPAMSGSPKPPGARSTVAEALKALEDAGVLTWVQRIKRVRESCPDLLGDEGWRWRVLRTSNSYAFTDPSPAAERPNSSKSENQPGTPNQVLFPLLVRAAGASDPLEASLSRLSTGVQSRNGP